MVAPTTLFNTNIPIEYLGTSGTSIGLGHPAFNNQDNFTLPINIMVRWTDQNNKSANDLLYSVVKNLRLLTPKVNRDVEIEPEKIESFLDIDKQISAIEQKAGMSSSEFYSKWINDETPDIFENNAWAILVESRDRLLGY